jgi:hypothetical protein
LITGVGGQTGVPPERSAVPRYNNNRGTRHWTTGVSTRESDRVKRIRPQEGDTNQLKGAAHYYSVRLGSRSERRGVEIAGVNAGVDFLEFVRAIQNQPTVTYYRTYDVSEHSDRSNKTVTGSQ